MRLTEYDRVHQGGHHDVYCNGKIHITTLDGGKCHDDIDKSKHANIHNVYLCNCDKFKPR